MDIKNIFSVLVLFALLFPLPGCLTNNHSRLIADSGVEVKVYQGEHGFQYISYLSEFGDSKKFETIDGDIFQFVDLGEMDSQGYLQFQTLPMYGSPFPDRSFSGVKGKLTNQKAGKKLRWRVVVLENGQELYLRDYDKTNRQLIKDAHAVLFEDVIEAKKMVGSNLWISNTQKHKTIAMSLDGVSTIKIGVQ